MTAFPLPARAALFDMDRTLLRCNSGQLFMRFRWRRGEVSALRMMQVGLWLAQYSVGILDAEKVARKLVSEYRGVSERDLTALCEEWAEDEIVPLISPDARRTVELHQQAGDLVAIVTSSTRYGTAPIARQLGIKHLLCSELEVEDGVFTGELLEPLSYGHGKVEKARGLLSSQGLDLSDAVFYSDSVTDLPLLDAVETPIVVNPDKRLKQTARKRGWEIRAW